MIKQSHNMKLDQSALCFNLLRHLHRGVRQPVIRVLRDCLNLPKDCLWQQHGGYSVAYPLCAHRASSSDLPICDTPLGHQWSCSTSVEAWQLAQWHSGEWTEEARHHGRFSCLDHGCYVDAHHPSNLSQYRAHVGRCIQYRMSTSRTQGWVIDLLPHPIALEAQTLSTHLVTNRVLRDYSTRTRIRNASCQFAPTPARQQQILSMWRWTGRSCRLYPHLRGKLLASVCATCAHYDWRSQLPEQVVGFTYRDGHRLAQFGHAYSVPARDGVRTDYLPHACR
jgi:hypothetical protein